MRVAQGVIYEEILDMDQHLPCGVHFLGLHAYAESTTTLGAHKSRRGSDSATWRLYKNEELLSGRHDFTLCGTSDAPESKDARFCFRRMRDQLVIYIALPHEKLRTARAGIVTYIRVDSHRPLSPRTARTAPWGRGFDPRMPGLSFPVDGTNPRAGVLEPAGFYSQLLEGETLSALVPLEPARFGEYTIHLDGLAPLLRELWEHDQ